MNEREAIALLKQGDINGLATLVENHQVKAVRTAVLITRDRALAEDVVQDTFIRIFRKIDQFDESRPFAPWFMRSVVNASVQAVRRQTRVVSLHAETDAETAFIELLADDASQSPLEAFEATEQTQLIKQALDELSPEQRAAIVMRYYLDMSEAEMADALDAPNGTVKWRLHAARQRLRGLLQRLVNPATQWEAENG